MLESRQLINGFESVDKGTKRAETMSIPRVSYKALILEDNEISYKTEVQKLAQACSQWGFVYLVDLDLDQQIEEIFKASKSFFESPLSSKLSLSTQKYQSTNKNKYRGYFPVSEASHSVKEGFEIGFHGYQLTDSDYIFNENSVYPNPEPFSGWGKIMDCYFDKQLEIGNTLLRAFEYHFDLPNKYFRSRFVNTLSTLRLLHYPGISNHDHSKLEMDGDYRFSAPSHTDSGILTLLLQDKTGGLEVKSKEGVWTSAPPVNGSLIMNIGDLLERWTGGEFTATDHRIIAPENSRYSIPFFFEPENNAIIEPFKSGTNFDTTTYECYLNEKIQSFVEYQSLPA